MEKNNLEPVEVFNSHALPQVFNDRALQVLLPSLVCAGFQSSSIFNSVCRVCGLSSQNHVSSLFLTACFF